MSEDQGRRRDDVDPATQLFVQQELGETRHALRNDIAALGTKVDTAAIIGTKEHAEVKAKLDQVIGATADLPARVTALELAAAVDVAEEVTRSELRKQSRSQFRWLVGLIIAAIPSAAAVAAYVSH